MSAKIKMIDKTRVIVSIWKEGSLTAAAKKLGVSIATISRALSELENELGVVLFERSTRTLRVTEQGKELAIRLERGLNEIEQALQMVREQEETLTGTVRLTLLPSLEELFAPMFFSFQQSHPDIKLQIYVTERRLSYALDNVDLMIRSGALVEEKLVAKPLATYHHVLCALPQIANAISQPKELSAHPLVAWGHEHSHPTWTLCKGKQKEVLSINPPFLSNDYALISSMIQQGGVGELPYFLAQSLVDSGTLVRVLPDWQLPEVTMYVMYAYRLLPKTVRVLVDHLRKEFSNLNQKEDTGGSSIQS